MHASRVRYDEAVASSAPLEQGLRIEVIWFDADLLELRVQASNGRFAAVCDLYAPHTAPSELAALIEGFPRSADDAREVVLALLHLKFAGGGVRMIFRCTDPLGRAEVHLDVQQPIGNGPERETASFAVGIEPAAVDRFVAAVRRMHSEVGSHAHLRSLP